MAGGNQTGIAAGPSEQNHSRFKFETGDSYQISVIDYGSAGLLLQIKRKDAPYWDRNASVMLKSEQVNEFLRWACRTVDRPAMVLPERIEWAMRRILKNGKLTRTIKGVFEDAIKILYNLRQPNLAERAIRR